MLRAPSSEARRAPCILSTQADVADHQLRHPATPGVDAKFCKHRAGHAAPQSTRQLAGTEPDGTDARAVLRDVELDVRASQLEVARIGCEPAPLEHEGRGGIGIAEGAARLQRIDGRAVDLTDRCRGIPLQRGPKRPPGQRRGCIGAQGCSERLERSGANRRAGGHRVTTA